MNIHEVTILSGLPEGTMKALNISVLSVTGGLTRIDLLQNLTSPQRGVKMDPPLAPPLAHEARSVMRVGSKCTVL